MSIEYNSSISGFLLIDKEKGYTSFDVCNKIKHKFKFKKVGHNGTLDPNATGLMLIGINNSTKDLFKLNNENKEYIATIVFGMESVTFDIDCDEIKINKNIEISENSIDKALNELRLNKQQIPPMFSSIKINGKKMYNLARAGVKVDLEPRNIEIYKLERISDIYLSEDFKCIDIILSVSKGFYVRSFVRDLCKILNIPGLLKNLRRTKNGDFDIKNAKKIDQITLNDIFTIDFK